MTGISLHAERSRQSIMASHDSVTPALRRASWLGVVALIAIIATVLLVIEPHAETVAERGGVIAVCFEILILFGVIGTLARRAMHQTERLEAQRSLLQEQADTL